MSPSLEVLGRHCRLGADGSLSSKQAAIEEAQGWRRGYLSMALERLVGDGDASFQQELEDQVERLMTSRGVQHERSPEELEPLKALRFEG